MALSKTTQNTFLRELQGERDYCDERDLIIQWYSYSSHNTSDAAETFLNLQHLGDKKRKPLTAHYLLLKKYLQLPYMNMKIPKWKRIYCYGILRGIVKELTVYSLYQSMNIVDILLKPLDKIKLPKIKTWVDDHDDPELLLFEHERALFDDDDDDMNLVLKKAYCLKRMMYGTYDEVIQARSYVNQFLNLSLSGTTFQSLLQKYMSTGSVEGIENESWLTAEMHDNTVQEHLRYLSETKTQEEDVKLSIQTLLVQFYNEGFMKLRKYSTYKYALAFQIMTYIDLLPYDYHEPLNDVIEQLFEYLSDNQERITENIKDGYLKSWVHCYRKFRLSLHTRAVKSNEFFILLEAFIQIYRHTVIMYGGLLTKYTRTIMYNLYNMLQPIKFTYDDKDGNVDELITDENWCQKAYERLNEQNKHIIYRALMVYYEIPIPIDDVGVKSTIPKNFIEMKEINGVEVVIENATPKLEFPEIVRIVEPQPNFFSRLLFGQKKPDPKMSGKKAAAATGVYVDTVDDDDKAYVVIPYDKAIALNGQKLKDLAYCLGVTSRRNATVAELGMNMKELAKKVGEVYKLHKWGDVTSIAIPTTLEEFQKLSANDKIHVLLKVNDDDEDTLPSVYRPQNIAAKDVGLESKENDDKFEEYLNSSSSSPPSTPMSSSTLPVTPPPTTPPPATPPSSSASTPSGIAMGYEATSKAGQLKHEYYHGVVHAIYALITPKRGSEAFLDGRIVPPNEDVINKLRDYLPVYKDDTKNKKLLTTMFTLWREKDDTVFEAELNTFEDDLLNSDKFILSGYRKSPKNDLVNLPEFVKEIRKYRKNITYEGYTGVQTSKLVGTTGKQLTTNEPPVPLVEIQTTVSTTVVETQAQIDELQEAIDNGAFDNVDFESMLASPPTSQTLEEEEVPETAQNTVNAVTVTVNVREIKLNALLQQLSAVYASMNTTRKDKAVLTDGTANVIIGEIQDEIELLKQDGIKIEKLYTHLVDIKNLYIQVSNEYVEEANKVMTSELEASEHEAKLKQLETDQKLLVDNLNLLRDNAKLDYETAIQNVKNELELAQTKITDLSSQLSVDSPDLADKLKQIQILEASEKSLNDQLKNVRQGHATMKLDLEKQLEVLKTEIQETKTEIVVIHENGRPDQPIDTDAVKELHEYLAVLENDVNYFVEQIKLKDAEIQNLGSTSASASVLNVTIAGLRDEKDRLQREMEEIEKDFNDAKAKSVLPGFDMKHMSTFMDNLKTSYGKLESEVETRDNALKILQEQYDQLKLDDEAVRKTLATQAGEMGKLQNVANRIKVFQDAIHLIDTDIPGYDSDHLYVHLEKLQKKYESTHNRVQVLESERKKVQVVVSELAGILDVTLTTTEALDQQISALKTEAVGLKSKADAVPSTDVTKKIAELTKELSTMEAAKLNAETTLTEQIRKISVVSDLADGGTVETIMEKIKELKRTGNSMKDQFNKLGDLLGVTPATYVQVEDVIHALKMSNDDLTKSMHDIGVVVGVTFTGKNAADVVNRVKQHVDLAKARNTEIEKLKAEIKKVEAALTEAKKATPSAGLTPSAAVTDLKKKLDVLQKHHDETEKKAKLLEQANQKLINDTKKQFEQEHAKNQELLRQIKSMKEKIAPGDVATHRHFDKHIEEVHSTVETLKGHGYRLDPDMPWLDGTKHPTEPVVMTENMAPNRDLYAVGSYLLGKQFNM